MYLRLQIWRHFGYISIFFKFHRGGGKILATTNHKKYLNLQGDLGATQQRARRFSSWADKKKRCKRFARLTELGEDHSSGREKMLAQNSSRIEYHLTNRSRSVSCDRAIRYSGLGVCSVGPVGDYLAQKKGRFSPLQQ